MKCVVPFGPTVPLTLSERIPDSTEMQKAGDQDRPRSVAHEPPTLVCPTPKPVAASTVACWSFGLFKSASHHGADGVPVIMNRAGIGDVVQSFQFFGSILRMISTIMGWMSVDDAAMIGRAVEQAYEVFAQYSVGSRLDVCRCSVCMDDEDIERQLTTTPLRNISAELLCEFTNSAHAAGRATEVKYFLPRYFDLLAMRQQTSHNGTEMALGRLAESDWETWPANERDAIGAFFDALWRDAAAGETLAARHGAEEILIMLFGCRYDVIAMLGRSFSRADKRELGTIAHLTQRMQWSDKLKAFKMGNPFWKAHDALALTELLCSDRCISALFAALDDPSHPELDDILTTALEFLT